MSSAPIDYSKTVNLLQTAFPMKADLPVREPQMLERWQTMGLYEKVQRKNAGKKVFLLHDGPPYANGEIHMGHALNKVLKDIVVKYKSLSGFQSPYKPGWDCHGLPIEHQLFKQLGKSKHQVSRSEVRAKAAEYARGFVDKQREGFKRLGVMGEWDNPYLTLSDAYESRIVETFYELRDAGFVYKGLKPGYWCAFDETALAEAEVEYADKTSDSVFVRFKVKPETLPAAVKSQAAADTYVLIWTTTPWTLPANRGLAFHPDEKYVVLEKGGARYIVAEKLKGVAAKFDAAEAPCTAFKGSDYVGLVAVNPLNGLDSRAVTASYVTMEDGTGIVHIAPGHGVEDFAVGQKWDLETASPVDERGLYTEAVGRPELVGKHVLKDANKAVMDLLGENLVYHLSFRHSYPHCWRCKNPIVFRATSQWFMEVSDAFRKTLIERIDAVRWEPAYGIHRIKGMVETRPDWCLSRQRHWGAPIAVFHCADKACGELLWDKALNAAIVTLIAEKGATTYYEMPEDELVSIDGKKRACGKCGKSAFRKEMDILDVWFDSGVSWHAVVEKEFSTPRPEAVMYLEGSDQHRGWFQTSLIPSVALRKKAPFDVVLTHGFVVDGKGHKMSKSLGNVISPQEIIKLYGADVLRLWVAMSDYREDVRLSQDIVKHMVDVYRRFRNVFRFLLQNTADFRWSTDRVETPKLEDVDRWMMGQFEELKIRVLKAYDAYEFHVVLSDLNRFAAVNLSGFYLDAQKDTLYCEAPTSPRRRSAQTVLAHLTRGLSLLLAPMLSFTAEEAYLELRAVSMPDLPGSVFLDDIASLPLTAADAAVADKWFRVFEVRSLVNDEMERQRKAGAIRSSQEAAVTLNRAALKPGLLDATDGVDWAFVFQAASVSVENAAADAPSVRIERSSAIKCPRCWRHRPDVVLESEAPSLCSRCREAMAAIPAGA